MSANISDKLMAEGLRRRKKPEAIEADVRGTIVGQMVADAMRVPLHLIQRSPYQVRHFNEAAIEDLMESIRDTGGLITPVVLRPSGELNYELIAGHTRFEACKRLGFTDIPAVVRPMSDGEAAKALAADNMTRKDLSDFEIFKQLSLLFAQEYLKSNTEASRLLGRSRQDIIRYMAFARMPQEVIELLERDPTFVGASAAKDLVELVESGHQDLVVEACRRLFDGHIKTQTAAAIWVRQKMTERPIRQEFRVLNSKGKLSGRVVISNGGIKITGNGLDYAKIEALLKEELPKLITE